MRAVIAVRYSGYWATGEFMLGEMPQAFQRQACAAMELALSRVRAGATRDQICAAIDGCDIVCHGIGLSFEEAPFIERDDALREGDVINLVVTLRIAEGQSAAWSAMARVEKSSARVLWTAPDIKRSAETVSARRRD